MGDCRILDNVAIALIFTTQAAPQLLLYIFCIFSIPVLNRRAIFIKRLELDGK